ncbi:MAG: hypothetical protein QXF28_02310 [Nitrososphaerota archaeon]
MKTVAGYGLIIGITYISSTLIFLIENMSGTRLLIPQLLPEDGGMAFYFITVGSLYGYAYFKSREKIFETVLLVASIMSIAIMLVQLLNSTLNLMITLTSNAWIIATYNLSRIEIILGLLSIPLLLRIRRDIYE